MPQTLRARGLLVKAKHLGKGDIFFPHRGVLRPVYIFSSRIFYVIPKQKALLLEKPLNCSFFLRGFAPYSTIIGFNLSHFSKKYRVRVFEKVTNLTMGGLRKF